MSIAEGRAAVANVRTETFPPCSRCPHTWHGLMCEKDRVLPDIGKRRCGCATSWNANEGEVS